MDASYAVDMLFPYLNFSEQLLVSVLWFIQ